MPGQYAKRIVSEYHADSVTINLNIGVDPREEDGKTPKPVEVVVQTTEKPLLPLETVEEPSRLLQWKRRSRSVAVGGAV